MKKLKIGLVGAGFIGKVHIDAIKRISNAELFGICEVDSELAKKYGVEYNIPLIFTDFSDMLNCDEIDVIHNCTPNHLHFQINKDTINAGKHLFCEKPFTTNLEEATKLYDLAKTSKSIVGLNFNYRTYPQIIKYKKMFDNGEMGKPRLVFGKYLQDWLFYETDYNWRLEKEYSGPSRAVADIGCHLLDISQYILGTRVVEVFADFTTAMPTRKDKDKIVNIDTEDYASVLVHFENNVTGNFFISQVSAGHKCDLSIEIDTDLCSFAWSHENPDNVWIGNRDKGNIVELRGVNTLSNTELPAGHIMGFNDATLINIQNFYNKILGTDEISNVATIEDGYYIMKVIDAIIKSSKIKAWVKI